MANQEVAERVFRSKLIGIEKESIIECSVPAGGTRRITSPGSVRLREARLEVDMPVVFEVRKEDDVCHRSLLVASRSNVIKMDTNGELIVMLRNPYNRSAKVMLSMVWSLL